MRIRSTAAAAVIAATGLVATPTHAAAEEPGGRVLPDPAGCDVMRIYAETADITLYFTDELSSDYEYWAAEVDFGLFYIRSLRPETGAPIIVDATAGYATYTAWNAALVGVVVGGAVLRCTPAGR